MDSQATLSKEVKIMIFNLSLTKEGKNKFQAVINDPRTLNWNLFNPEYKINIDENEFITTCIVFVDIPVFLKQFRDIEKNGREIHILESDAKYGFSLTRKNQNYIIRVYGGQSIPILEKNITFTEIKNGLIPFFEEVICLMNQIETPSFSDQMFKEEVKLNFDLLKKWEGPK